MFYKQRISRCQTRNKVSASSQEVTTEEQGQISSELMQQMKESITNNLEADKVEVTNVYGDGRHVNIEVVSKLFDGQSSMKRQRLVYKVSNCLGTTCGCCHFHNAEVARLGRIIFHST